MTSAPMDWAYWMDSSCVEFGCPLTEIRIGRRLQFGQTPTTFRNTELVIDPDLPAVVEELGFEVMLGEGSERLLGELSPQLVYAVAQAAGRAAVSRGATVCSPFPPRRKAVARRRRLGRP